MVNRPAAYPPVGRFIFYYMQILWARLWTSGNFCVSIPPLRSIGRPMPATLSCGF